MALIKKNKIKLRVKEIGTAYKCVCACVLVSVGVDLCGLSKALFLFQAFLIWACSEEQTCLCTCVCEMCMVI